MATHTRRLDRKTRSTLVTAGALIAIGPILMIASHVAAKLDQGNEQVFEVPEDELVQLPDGSTMHVRQGSSGQKIREWLHLDKVGEQTFEVGNENFAPGSATLTRDGWEHLAQFAQMMKAHSEVSAVVLFSPRHGDPGTLKLEHLRADRIREQTVKLGVRDDQIAVSEQAFEAAHNAAADEGLEVVLTNRI